jgi:hypothetical protein
MYTQEEIIQGLEDKYAYLTQWLENQKDENFSISSTEGKWSTGEHIDHLIKSTKPLNMAMRLPKMQLRMMFGKPNREGRTFEQIVARYKVKLADNNGQTTSRYEPKNITNDKKQELIKTLQDEKERLQRITSKWREKDLDNYLLPHPLLGKMTIREIMLFTIYHTQHHIDILEKSY